MRFSAPSAQVWLSLLGLVVGAAPAWSGDPKAPDDGVAVRYVLRPDATLRTAELEACAPPGTRFMPGVARLKPKLLWKSDEGCRGYRIDLSAVSLAQGLRWRVLWVGAMLPRPARAPAQLSGRLRIVVPVDAQGALAWRFLGPWPQDRAGDFVLNASAFERRGRLLVGHMPVIHRAVGDTAFRLAAPDFERGVEALGETLGPMAEAVASLAGGRFPLAAAQLVLVPEPGDTVGFGLVERGGGAGVFLSAGRGLAPATLRADWTPYHELAHLLLPPLSDAVWFAEGYASYAQQVARARAGALSPGEAAAALDDGFARGATQVDGRTLAEASAGVDARGDYWRVYWGGAAFFLEADLALRRAGSSLDALVARWGGLSRADGGPLPLAALLSLAEAHHPAAGLKAMAQRHLQGTEFPPARAWLAQAVAEGTWAAITAGPEPAQPDRAATVKPAE